MPTDTVSATQPTRRGLVVALHCSGAGANQWRRLGAELGGDCELVAPEHYGCENIGAWTGEHAFTLANEAARTIALIDSCDRKVHLVGHSYGRALALHIALKRPNRIASLALYELSAFHLLNLTETGEHAAFQEIVAITRETGNGVITGDYRAGGKGANVPARSYGDRPLVLRRRGEFPPSRIPPSPGTLPRSRRPTLLPFGPSDVARPGTDGPRADASESL
jgi:pimeloyl-ACP methyl ester carboxylesterase